MNSANIRAGETIRRGSALLFRISTLKINKASLHIGTRKPNPEAVSYVEPCGASNQASFSRRVEFPNPGAFRCRSGNNALEALADSAR